MENEVFIRDLLEGYFLLEIEKDCKGDFKELEKVRRLYNSYNKIDGGKDKEEFERILKELIDRVINVLKKIKYEDNVFIGDFLSDYLEESEFYNDYEEGV